MGKTLKKERYRLVGGLVLVVFLSFQVASGLAAERPAAIGLGARPSVGYTVRGVARRRRRRYMTQA